MARRKFDSSTRRLFEQIQRQISIINGKLLNENLAGVTRTELNDLKAQLKSERKELKARYARETDTTVTTESKEILEKIRKYDVKQIKKY
ncbi:MAG: hypothetical protein RIT38_1095 [Bacteroidota bacterium]|jgi:hypothetical protein